jgi:hypothetical protein
VILGVFVSRQGCGKGFVDLVGWRSFKAKQTASESKLGPSIHEPILASDRSPIWEFLFFLETHIHQNLNSTVIPRSSNQLFQLHTHNEWKNSPVSVSSLIFQSYTRQFIGDIQIILLTQSPRWKKGEQRSSVKLLFSSLLFWLLPGPKSYPSLSYQMTFKKYNKKYF